jgi:hypothetical protein
MQCNDIIARYLGTLEGGFSCVPSGIGLQIVTPYVYPNNDLIELYLEELPNDLIRVTDLGETLRNLDSQGFDVSTSPKRKFLFSTILSRTNVELAGGQITKTGTIDDIGNVLFDVLVAARGAADLIYTSKAYEPALFLDEVKEFLTEQGLQFTPSVRVPGQTGKIYKVDLEVLASRSFMQTISPISQMATKPKVDGTFRMWSDVNGQRRKVTLLNDIEFEWKEPDVNILSRVSRVHFWSHRDDLLDAIRA